MEWFLRSQRGGKALAANEGMFVPTMEGRRSSAKWRCSPCRKQHSAVAAHPATVDPIRVPAALPALIKSRCADPAWAIYAQNVGTMGRACGNVCGCGVSAGDVQRVPSAPRPCSSRCLSDMLARLAPVEGRGGNDPSDGKLIGTPICSTVRILSFCRHKSNRRRRTGGKDTRRRTRPPIRTIP
jgi:hypothetical protein